MDDLTGRLRRRSSSLGDGDQWQGADGELMSHAADCIEEQADKAMILKRVLARKEARIERLEGRGPADIGMVPVRMDRPATGEITQLWREATDE